MIRRCLSNAVILVCLLLTAAIAQAQDRTAGTDNKVQPNPVDPVNPTEDVTYDDDGGRVFLVRRDAVKAVGDLHSHGGKVIAAPREYTILLGRDWSKILNQPSAAFARSAAASAVSGLQHPTNESMLASRGVAEIAAQPAQQQDPVSIEDSNGSPVSDLQVQAALSESFKRGTIGFPDQNTIYTIFLPPGATSTIGGLLGGKHYLAYHNFFHVDDVEIHYVVVPFQGNERLMRSAVTRALIEAILNPSGDGWF